MLKSMMGTVCTISQIENVHKLSYLQVGYNKRVLGFQQPLIPSYFSPIHLPCSQQIHLTSGGLLNPKNHTNYQGQM